jgi:hypothetical protein
MNKLVFNEQTFEFKKWYHTENTLSVPSYQIHCFVDGKCMDVLKVTEDYGERVLFANNAFQTVSNWDGEFSFNNCVEYVNYYKEYENKFHNELKKSNK